MTPAVMMGLFSAVGFMPAGNAQTSSPVATVRTAKAPDGTPCIEMKDSSGRLLVPGETVKLSAEKLPETALKPCVVQTNTSKSEKDISVGGGIFFTPDRQGTQGTTHNSTALGSFHQQFNPWLGYKGNFGFSHIEEIEQNAIRTTTNAFELSGMYVVQQPGYYKRLQMFAEAGAGALFFHPTDAEGPSHNSTRPTFNFGVGANVKLTSNLSLRLEYRGLMYKAPDFGLVLPSTFSAYPRYMTVTHEPTFSFVYRFGKH